MMRWALRSTLSSISTVEVNMLRILHLQEGVMLMNTVTLTFLTEVKVRTLNALVSDTRNWSDLASITSDSVMNNLLSIF